MSTDPFTIVTGARRGFGDLTSEWLELDVTDDASVFRAIDYIYGFGLAHLAEIPAAEVAP